MSLSREQVEALAEHLGKTKRQLQRYKPIEPSQAVVTEYAREIGALANQIMKRVKGEVLPILEKIVSSRKSSLAKDEDLNASLKNAFDVIEQSFAQQQKGLDDYAARTATKAFTAQNRFHRRAWVKELNKLAGIDVRKIVNESAVEAALPARIEENIKLIKTVKPEYLEQVKKEVYSGLSRGDDFFSIKKRLGEVETYHTKYRPRLIARDQMNKLTGALNQIRQEDVGIREYTWRTSHDERVRPSHRANNGRVFSWSKPPATGHPGEDIQCRCVAEPKFDKWLRSLSQKKSWKPKK